MLMVLGAVACADPRDDGAAFTGGESGGSDGDGSGGDGDGTPVCDPERPAPRRVRRLSHREYARTLQDLVGADPVQVEGQLAPDEVVHGYANNARALTVSFLLADQYRALAEDMADVIVGDFGAHSSCVPVEALDVGCATAFVRSFGERVFRRPLEPQDVDRYVDLWSEVALEDDSFESGIRWALVAMLQSPNFLYRTELGAPAADGTFHLDGWEIASELSYLLTGGPPDEELWVAAGAGSLDEPEEIAAQVSRLLQTEAAHRTHHRFADAWLGTRQLEHVPRADEALTPTIRLAMREELARLLSAALAGGWTLADLLTRPTTFLTPALASYYGLPAPEDVDADGFGAVEDERSSGLLSQGALLTTHARPSGSSPIHRGELIRERMLCQPLPPPPPALDVSPPAPDPDLSTRERYQQHASDPACAGCHRLIDPIGFAFEHYDGVGRYRERDGEHQIDASGELTRAGDAEGSFDGVAELGARLADSADVRACYASQWLEFALGLSMDREEAACVRKAIVDGFEVAGGRLDVLAPTLAQTSYLRIRGEETGDPGVEPPGGEGSGTSGGGTGGGSSTGPATTGDGTDPGGDPSLEVEIIPQSSWETGQCDDVRVTNVSSGPITWTIPLTLPGDLSNAWNARYVPDPDDARTVTFTGTETNAALDSGEDTTFGYCVTL